ncbi:VTT domain-containing protein [Candidatus Bathyarchaeota archaeon]|nr:VTT domain-containing protein [Candidatus Bathyarchaeota archaeon]
MAFEDLIGWLMESFMSLQYVGVFLISLIGSLSILFPIPYTVVIFTLGKTLEPLLIAVAAGLGSAIGEFSGYALGWGGRKAISDKYRKKMEFLAKAFDRYGPWAVFLFALTPLPDDLLFIPLGVMRYKITKVFIPALLGKFLMSLIVAYSGRFTITIIENIFGVESSFTSAIIGTVIAVILLLIILVIMFKVDWEKRFGKYIVKKEDSEQKA